MAVTPLYCPALAQGLVIRVTKLDACGVPITGVNSAQVVMDAFTEVVMSPQYDTGDRKITRKANGTLCQNYKLPDQFTNNELTINMCTLNPGTLVTALGARLLTATTPGTGTGVAYGTWANITPVHWSLELWGPPPQGCGSSGVFYPYQAWPHLSDGKLGDMTFGEDPTEITITANSYDASPLWNLGAAYLGAGAIVQGDHWDFNYNTVAPPASACQLVTI